MCSSNKNIKAKKSNSRSSDRQKLPCMKKRNKKKTTTTTSSSTHQCSSPKPGRRKTRTKTRKHKFLSLREVELSESSISLDSREMMMKSDQNHHHHHQLDLFPLHPENLLEEKEDQDHDQNNMADFFNTDGGATLNGLLWGGNTDQKCSSDHDKEDSYLSPALTYAYQGQDSHHGEGGESSDLARTALRHREEKDANEGEEKEKWVSYEEVLVMEKKHLEEEVMSSSFTPEDHQNQNQNQNQIKRLSLKLDYEEIMNAWSDKGSFYIGGDNCSSQPQIVPDILHLHDNVLGDTGGSLLWRVPSLDDGSCSTTGIEAVDGGGGGDYHHQEGMMMKMVEREARVLRYKEKRQSRLFSKRIRYQVRKLNAEKRPRMKGRFVKRN